MRIGYTLLLIIVSFTAGAAVGGRAAHREPRAPAQTPEVAAPAATEGQRDPKADLEGQMMWDPVSRTYVGG